MISSSPLLIVRHAQSAANAGLRTRDPASIPLTETGISQAKKLANCVSVAPSLIVTSSFARTSQTAAPIVERYPDARREQWPIHEFT